MEDVMLHRLSLVADQIDKLTTEALRYFGEVKDDVKGARISAEKLETAINRFTAELHNYFRLSTEPAADEISNFSMVQLKGEETLAELKVRLNLEERPQGRVGVPEGDNRNATLTSRLPRLELEKFTGDVLSWTPFWDQFESNIGSKNLSDVDKLLYLKSSLEGEALKTIEGLETSSKNYQIAISILKDRYGKHNLIVDAHYAALNRINTAEGSAARCRETLNDIERHLRILQSLGEDVNHNHLRFLILEKFPQDILYELKMKIKEETVEEIRKGLQLIISAREDSSRITPGKSASEVGETYTTKILHVQNKRSKPSSSWKRAEKRQNNQRNNYQEQQDNLRQGEDYRRNERSTQGNKEYFSNHLKRKFSTDYTQPTYGTRRKLECVFCQRPHSSDQCRTFKTNKERISRLKGRCYRCLQEGHFRLRCQRSDVICGICNKRDHHHTALCPKRCVAEVKRINALHVNSKNCSTVLQTAVAIAKREEGSEELSCRLLLDSGSQRTYITQELAQKLNLPVEEECKLLVFTFGAKFPQEIDSALVKLQIQTRRNTTISLYANVVPTISVGVPNHNFNLDEFTESITLADDGSRSPEIDILIGNDYYFTLIERGRIDLTDELFLIESKFGWILTGSMDEKSVDVLSALTYFQSGETKLTPPDLPLDNGSMKCLWDLESIGICDSPKVTRDEDAIRQFNETTEIIDNRYIVQWPWKEYPPDLPVNFGLAYGRLINLVKRSDKNMISSYNDTIIDQLEKGIIEIIPDEEVNTLQTEKPMHYLPFHCINQGMEGEKRTRIVYDASSRTKDSKSLNECLYSGPLLLEDLTGIFMRFRSHQIGIIADVEKAFLMIGLQRKDRDVTRFLWLQDMTKPPTKDNLLHLRFCRVPFGVISSPFLLNATVKHHLTYNNKKALKELAQDIYVDNLVTGVETKREANKLYENAKRAFRDISMNLRVWCSNSKEFMESISKDDRCTEEQVKVLGLKWCPEDDTIQLRCKQLTPSNTKRQVLKTIASIYDPCGFAVPSVLPAKLFLQELWKRKLKWDMPLPTDLVQEWERIVTIIEGIRNISIPRRFFNQTSSKRVSLHCFVDASIKAYAAVVYITNGLEVSFVIGKSRLVPVKDQENLRIPRLELLGALIGSRLIKYVANSLRYEIREQILWTDSQIVRDWCQSNKMLPPFVSRRIEEIKANKSLTIRKVATNLNPADIATRPYCTEENKEIWLKGPEFLRRENGKQPVLCETELSLFSREVLASQPATQTASQEKRIQTASEVSERERQQNKLTPGQDNNAISNIQQIKYIQEEHFPDEVKGKETDLSRNLRLFVDVDGLLRCKGRLTNANWSFDKRYPILIPGNSDFTDNIIQTTHEDNFHVGVNHTLSLIRQTYWIPKGRCRVQRILKGCKTCVKHGGGPFKLPSVPALPKERVNYSSPFSCVGMDYFGPLYIKSNSNKEEKRWICLYTCLAVRAIHLEVVDNLSADECLLALRRFISTRSVPALIVSDNAQQFKLMAEVLSDTYCISNKIGWKFIPQLAPWHGGFYERLIGIVKQCLKKSLTKQLLKENQLTTIIKEIEAVVNTRPLTCVGAELEDVLKPSDFLTMGSCITTEPADQMIQPGSSVTKRNLIEAWKRGQNVLNDFKIMFMNQYLPSLRERYQHSHKEPRLRSRKEPQVGDIVQIKGEAKNRENWKVGKIINLLKGQDGMCRIARVKVGETELTRSITHLYPLEMDEELLVENQTATKEGRQFISKAPIIHSEIRLPPPVGTSSPENELHGSAPEPMNIEEEIPSPLEEPLSPNLISENEAVNNGRDIEDDHSNHSNDQDNSITKGETGSNERKPHRAAFLKAEQKIREWTRALIDYL